MERRLLLATGLEVEQEGRRPLYLYGVALMASTSRVGDASLVLT